MRIYITGFMGSGKSTFGKELAETLGYGFTDLDKEIEKQEGKTIAQIFEDKGETYFREAEHKALLATEKQENTVIATGGGTAVFHDQMNWMNEHGLTVYLKLFEGELKNRIKPEMAHRPLLKNLDPEQLEHYIYETLRQRSYHYHQAKIVMDPLALKPKDLAEIIRTNYK